MEDESKTSSKSSSAGHSSQFSLSDPPSGSISCVRFQHDSSDKLATASRDGVVRLYDVDDGKCIVTTPQGHPYLSCYATGDHVYYGGLDCTFYRTDPTSGATEILGTHDNVIRCVEYCETSRLLLTGSWDATVNLWDGKTLKSCRSIPQPDEVYCMDVRDDLLIVGAAGQIVVVWDLRNLKAPLSQRLSKLNSYQTSAIKLFPNKKMYALATIEGRVSIDSVLPNDKSVSAYAFKPHVEKPSGIGHPVNALAIHNPSSFFVTGASDKRVQLWDADKKRRVSEFHPYPSPVSFMDFSSDGSMLAIGCSYLNDMEVDPDPLPPTRIFIRSVNVDISKSSNGSNDSRHSGVSVLSTQNA